MLDPKWEILRPAFTEILDDLEKNRSQWEKAAAQNDLPLDCYVAECLARKVSELSVDFVKEWNAESARLASRAKHCNLHCHKCRTDRPSDAASHIGTQTVMLKHRNRSRRGRARFIGNIGQEKEANQAKEE